MICCDEKLNWAVGYGIGLHVKVPRDKHVFENQQNIFLNNQQNKLPYEQRS